MDNRRKHDDNESPMNEVTFRNNYPMKIPIALLDVLKNKKYRSEDSKNYSTILASRYFEQYTEDNYWYVNKLLLYLETYYRLKNFQKYNLKNVTLRPSKFYKNHFIIAINNISEEVHRIGTTVLIYKDKKKYKAKIEFVGTNHIRILPTSTLRTSNKFKPFCGTYDVTFKYSDGYSDDNINFVLNQIYNRPLWHILFPTIQSPRFEKSQSLIWFNESIKNNPRQKEAIIHILHRTAQPAPYILFGPPGTGKTTTLVETIYQIVNSNLSNRVLVCTPSNTAADLIIHKLFKYHIDKNILYRMYSRSKNVADINNEIKHSANCTDDDILYIPQNIFIKKKIVLTTLGSSIRLFGYNLSENHFSHIILDEIGQATEMETLIPLATTSFSSSNQIFCGQIVLSGDPKQLGPNVLTQYAKPLLGKSMLERFFELEPYKRLESSNKYNSMYITKLVLNYRSHPAILRLPNKLFYDNELISKGGEDIKRAEDWSGLLEKNFPVIFHAVNGKEMQESNSTSLQNKDEIYIVIEYVKKLINIKLGGKIVTEDQIGIITPYKLQKIKIQRKLKNEKIKNINVGTVEIFQGQERDIIIISLVRTTINKIGNRIHLGFLSDPKRFNVAITRPRALLIVIGDPRVLQIDEHWKAFIQYCIDHGSCCGDKFKLYEKLDESQIDKLIKKKFKVHQLHKFENGWKEEDPKLQPVNNNKNRRMKQYRQLPIGPQEEKFYKRKNDYFKKMFDCILKYPDDTHDININNNNSIDTKYKSDKDENSILESANAARSFCNKNSYFNSIETTDNTMAQLQNRLTMLSINERT